MISLPSRGRFNGVRRAPPGTILRRGGSLAALLDFELTRPADPRLLYLLHSLGAELVFVTTQLLDGKVLVEYFQPADPLCQSEESILANMEELYARAALALHLPSSPPAPAPIPSLPSAPSPPPRVRLPLRVRRYNPPCARL